MDVYTEEGENLTMIMRKETIIYTYQRGIRKKRGNEMGIRVFQLISSHGMGEVNVFDETNGEEE